MKTYTNLTAFLLAGIAAAAAADKFDEKRTIALLNSYAENMESRQSDQSDILAAAQTAWDQTGTATPVFASPINGSTTDAEDAEATLQDFNPEYRTGPEDDDAEADNAEDAEDEENLDEILGEDGC